MCFFAGLFAASSRRCLGNKVVREEQEDGSVRISCLDGCEDVTYCGEVIVPPEHLDVS